MQYAKDKWQLNLQLADLLPAKLHTEKNLDKTEKSIYIFRSFLNAVSEVGGVVGGSPVFARCKNWRRVSVWPEVE